MVFVHRAKQKENNLKNIDNCHDVKEMIVKNTESLLDNIRSTI